MARKNAVLTALHRRGEGGEKRVATSTSTPDGILRNHELDPRFLGEETAAVAAHTEEVGHGAV